MADSYTDLVVEVTRRSRIDRFPQNAARITRKALRHLNARLRLEQMSLTGQGETNDEGAMAIPSDVYALRKLTTDRYVLLQVSRLQPGQKGYVFDYGRPFLVSSEVETAHYYEYWQRLRDPSNENDSLGFDMLSFNYDLLCDAVLYHALFDSREYDAAAAVAEQLSAALTNEESRSVAARYANHSMRRPYPIQDGRV